MAEIVKTEGVLGGKARIDRQRVSVFGIAETVLDYDHSPEEVAHEVDISLSEVYAALSYYYDNLDEREAIRDRRRELQDELKKESELPSPRMS